MSNAFCSYLRFFFVCIILNVYIVTNAQDIDYGDSWMYISGAGSNETNAEFKHVGVRFGHTLWQRMAKKSESAAERLEMYIYYNLVQQKWIMYGLYGIFFVDLYSNENFAPGFDAPATTGWRPIFGFFPAPTSTLPLKHYFYYTDKDGDRRNAYYLINGTPWYHVTKLLELVVGSPTPYFPGYVNHKLILGLDCNDWDPSIHTEYYYYVDEDGDGYGIGSQVKVCAADEKIAPHGYATNNSDCNDKNPNIYRVSTAYIDNDRDGYGTGNLVNVCMGAGLPPGYSLNNSDCNDNNASIFSVGTAYIDNDRDGYGTGNLVNVCMGTGIPPGYSTNNSDCNDNDASMNTTYQFYIDNDKDGVGIGNLVTICARNGTIPPLGYSLINTDCDDNNSSIKELVYFYRDNDGDGYGSGMPHLVCAQNANTAPAGFSLNNLDCNDADANIKIKYGFYIDNDGDGYGLANSNITYVCGVNANTPPLGYANNNIDCDDNFFNSTAPSNCSILPFGNTNNILHFDGINDYIKTTQTINASNGSWEAWV